MVLELPVRRAALAGFMGCAPPSLTAAGATAEVADTGQPSTDLEVRTGDVTFIHSDDVRDYCEGVDVVEQEGDLTVGEWVSDLSALTCLRRVGGDLDIGGNLSLSSLRGLDRLETVDGTLYIAGCDRLTDLQGLGALTYTAMPYIYTNAGLTSLRGLDALGAVKSVLVWYNESLVSLSGLGSLEAIDGSLQIGDNRSLERLDGLESLESVSRDLEISFNDSLTDLSGLGALEAVGGDLSILYNEVLPQADAEAFVATIDTIGGEVEVRENGP